MRPDPMHDTLVACVQKLKKLVNEQQLSQDSSNDEFAAPRPLTLEERARRRVAGSSSIDHSPPPRDATFDEIKNDEMDAQHDEEKKNQGSSIETSWNSNYSIDVEYHDDDAYVEPKPEPLSLSLSHLVNNNNDVDQQANSDDELLLDDDLPADEQYPQQQPARSTTTTTTPTTTTTAIKTNDTQEDEDEDDLRLDDDLPEDERYYPIPSTNNNASINIPSSQKKHVASNNHQPNIPTKKRSHHDDDQGSRPLEEKEQPCTPIPPSRTTTTTTISITTSSPSPRQQKRIRSISPPPHPRDRVWKCSTCSFQNELSHDSCVFCKHPRDDAPEKDREERISTLSLHPSTLSTNAYQSTQCSMIDNQILSYATQDIPSSSSTAASSLEPTRMVHVMFTGMTNVSFDYVCVSIDD